MAETRGELGPAPWVALSPGSSTEEQGQGFLWAMGGVAQVPEGGCGCLAFAYDATVRGPEAE